MKRTEPFIFYDVYKHKISEEELLIVNLLLLDFSGFMENNTDEDQPKSLIKSLKMYLTMADDPSGDLSRQEPATFFDPKSFLETLFKTREAEIQVLLNNGTRLNTTQTGENDEESDFDNDYSYKPDVYFVIGAVSFIIMAILCLAIYKAFVMLKISLNDGIDDTVPVGNQNIQQRTENSQSSGHLWNGKKLWIFSMLTYLFTYFTTLKIFLCSKICKQMLYLDQMRYFLTEMC